MNVVPFVSNSATSEDAARSMVKPAAADRERVFAAISFAGRRGMTCDELEVALGMRHQSASARINDLQRERRIIASVRRRKTRSGRYAYVYLDLNLLCYADRRLLTRKST